MTYPSNLATEDRPAWSDGELVTGTDGHVVPPPAETRIEDSLYPESRS